MVDFGAIIGESVKWSKTVTFKPFNARKWIIVASLALFAGYTIGGCNMNFRNAFQPDRQKPAAIEHKAATAPQSSPLQSGRAATPAAPSKASVAAAIVVLVMVIALIVLLPFFLILFMWLAARLSFVFLEDVVNNDELIKIPFTSNKAQGNSLFKFNLLLMLAFLAAMALLAVPWVMTVMKTGIFNNTCPSPAESGKALALSIPYIIVFLALLLTGALINLILRDFVVPAMFKGRIKVMQAWREILGLLRANLLNFVVYVLIKMGLAICVAIGFAIAVLVAYMGLALPVAGTVLLFVLLFSVTPGFAMVYVFLAIGLLLAFLLPLMIFLTSLALPFSIFFRTFAVKFLAALDGKYDLFASRSPESMQPQISKEEISPALSGVFSFLSPGFGQVYNGQVLKGLFIFSTCWLFIPWIIGIIDAYKTAVRIRSGELPLERKIDVSAPRTPALACAMSFLFPGAGQLYNGQPAKGFFIFLLSIFVIPWILGIIDACQTAKAINAGKIHVERKVGRIVAAAVGMMAIVITVIIIIFIGIIIAAISNPNACR